MRENEKEYLEYWLSELKHEVGDYETELQAEDRKKTELTTKRRVISDLIRTYGSSSHQTIEKFKSHFDYDEIVKSDKELNSLENEEKNRELVEKIHFTQLAIQRVESILEKANTPA